MSHLRLFVIGASAGGHDAVIRTLSGIPKQIDAAFLVVIHSLYDVPTNFSEYLDKKLELTVKDAEDEEDIRPGIVYMSRPNQHLAVVEGKIQLSSGPRENLFRPAIDVLFRSAAVAYGHRTVGILLTGRLNDGTAGLLALKKCGGLAVIQNPKTAEFSDMPLSAQQAVAIDHVVDLAEMPSIIQEITQQPLPPAKTIPNHLIREAGIAMKIKKSDQNGKQPGRTGSAKLLELRWPALEDG